MRFFLTDKIFFKIILHLILVNACAYKIWDCNCVLNGLAGNICENIPALNIHKLRL